MNKTKFHALLVFLAGAILSPASLADAIGASIGVHGIAINYQSAFSKTLKARFVLSDMPLERDAEEDGIEYEVEYDRTNLGVLLDYHPIPGYFRRFHITGGIYTGDHNWNMRATANNQQLELGNDTYNSKNVELKAQVSFAKAAPYFGLGWGYVIEEEFGFYGNIDVGALYIGEASISYEAKGTVIDSNGNELDVSTFADFQGSIEQERANLESEIEDYNLLPIIQIGFAVTF